MSETTSRVCDHCGAPLRGLVDGYCPYCRTRPFAATGAGAAVPVGLHSVLLLDPGPNKISVIKALRDIVQREFSVELGLKEAMDLVERGNRAAPPALVVDVEPARAEAWVAAFAAAGAVVEITPPIGSVAPPVAASPAAPAGAPTSYAVYLMVVGRKKINVIKAVRESTGLGLKEAKDLVDDADHVPQLVLANLDQQAANAAAMELANAGATAEVRVV